MGLCCAFQLKFDDVVEHLPEYIEQLERLSLQIGVVEHVSVEQLSIAGVINRDLFRLRRRLRALVC